MVWKEFKNWLLGKEKPPDSKEIRVNLKVKKRRIERIEKGMKQERRKAINKVRKAIKNGNKELAIEHAKIAIIYAKDLRFLIKSKAKIVQFLNLLRRSTLTQSFSESIQGLASSLEEISSEISSPKLKHALAKTLRESEKIEMRTETLYETVDMNRVGGEVEKAAKNLVEEISVEEGIREEPVEKETISDEEVSKLLEEVKEEVDKSL